MTSSFGNILWSPFLTGSDYDIFLEVIFNDSLFFLLNWNHHARFLCLRKSLTYRALL